MNPSSCRLSICSRRSNGLKREIEVTELLDGGQSARAHRGLEAPVISQLNLRRQQLLDRFKCCHRAGVNAVEDRVERF
jgi:hypothetical protein